MIQFEKSLIDCPVKKQILNFFFFIYLPKNKYYVFVGRIFDVTSCYTGLSSGSSVSVNRKKT